MKAVIFDMDGVLTDSEPVICAAAQAMFREYGVEVPEADFVPFIGAGENKYIGGPAGKHGVEFDLLQAKARTYEIYLEIMPEILQAFPGAVDFVRACKAAGLKTAVASSADLIKVAANLEHIGIPPTEFDAVITAEKVEHRKPAPDIFLAAAKEIGVAPVDCCVIEDAVNGVEAAKAAGMTCIGVAQTFSADKLVAADLVKPGMADLSVDEIQSLG